MEALCLKNTFKKRYYISTEIAVAEISS